MAKKSNSIININKAIDRKAVFARAWEIAYEGVAKFGGKVKEYFKEALRMAWAEAKEAIKVVIPQWFMDKNKDKVESTNCKCVPYFGLADVTKESEKAILVKLPMVTKNGEFKTKFAKAVWIPKAILA